MEKRQGKLHYFDVGNDQFSCVLDYDYKDRWLWYSSNTIDDIFEVALGRGFKTPEACEKYIKKCIKKTCKDLLKGLSYE